jgi:mono/diheme cytochrome c family protein
MIVAAVPQAVAATVATLLLVGWVLYVLFNLRWGRPEAGSEVELAPNRKEYFDDEGMEGHRLEKMQVFGLAMLVVCAVGLPAYWILEPARQNGAQAGAQKKLANWGAAYFDVTGNGGFNCAGCHGGMKASGGNAEYTITDPNTGEVKAVTWNAPALNTVLYRFSEDEVRFILVYGRQFSPMSPWGTEGGGPMNFQQINTLIAYLKSIQLPQEGCTKENPLCKGKDGVLNAAAQKDYADQVAQYIKDEAAKGHVMTQGEALFQMSAVAGAYSCARCHTKGWSYGDPQQMGGGALGPNLTGGSETRQFPNVTDNQAFICSGSELGKKYGAQGQGSGRMPGYCGLLTEDQRKAVVEYIRGL